MSKQIEGSCREKKLRPALGIGALAAAALLVAPGASAQLPVDAKISAGGIALPAPWRAAVYAHARSKLLHPAWGWRHCERDFLLARQIARDEGLKIAKTPGRVPL